VYVCVTVSLYLCVGTYDRELCKTAEPIEMPLTWVRTRTGERESHIRWGPGMGGLGEAMRPGATITVTTGRIL